MSRRGLNLYLDATYGGGPAMRRMKGDLQGAKKTLDATAVANRRFSRSLGGSTWRRQVQQAGMQISDFSVQVAGGQSAMLAFTQNAPQFLQNFGAMGGVIAAAVTILGTFAFMALKSGAAVRSFKDQIDVVNDALGEYFSLLKQNKGIASDVFTEAERQIKGSSQAARDLLAVARIRAFNSVKGLADSLEKGATNSRMFTTASKDLRELLNKTDSQIESNVSTVTEYNAAVAKAKVQSESFAEILRGIGTASTLDAMLGNALKAREIFKSNVDVTGEMTEAQRTFLEQVSETILRLRLLGATGNSFYSETRDLLGINARMMEDFNEKIAAGNETARQKLATLNNEIELMRAINEHGEASEQVAGLRAEQEKRVFEQMLGTLNASTDLKNELREAFAQSQALANVDIESGIRAGATAAEQLARALGIAVSKALTLQNITPQMADEDAAMSQTVLPTAKERAAQRRAVENYKRLTKPDDPKIRPRMRPMDLGVSDAVEKAMTATGGAAKRVTKEAKVQLGEVSEAFNTTQEAISSSMMSAFKSLVDGTKSMGEAVNDILGSIRDRMLDLLLSPAINRLSGMLAGGVSSLFGGGPLAGNKLFDIAGSFYGGGQTRSGPRAGGLDGRGGHIAMVHPNETITDNRRGAAGGGRAAVVNNIKVVAPPGSEVREERQSNDSGGQDLTVIIDRAVSGLVRDPSSSLSRTLSAGFGINRSTRSR